MLNQTNNFETIKNVIDELDVSDKTKEKLYCALAKDINKITINGKSIEEVITILNGLDIERMLDIKMTMENLSYLYKKILEEQYKHEQMTIKKMMFGEG